MRIAFFLTFFWDEEHERGRDDGCVWLRRHAEQSAISISTIQKDSHLVYTSYKKSANYYLYHIPYADMVNSQPNRTSTI